MMKSSWDLSPLFRNDSDPQMIRVRKEVEKVSYAFINKWKERDDYLKNPVVLKTALDEYENWLRYYGAGAREWYYFNLRNSLDQDNPALKARLNKTQDFGKKIQNDILFFTLEVAKINAEHQKKFLKYKPLVPYKHFLAGLFLQARYQLSEPEEKILNLTMATSHSNWTRMLSGFLTKEEKNVLGDDEKIKVKNFSEILGLMDSKNKEVRDTAAKAFNEILQKHLGVAENELNSVLQNKKIDDELRKFESPDTARHISDDIEGDVVDTIIKVISSRFDIARRYYELKAKLFKVKKLAYHERNVPYGSVDKKYTFEDTVKLISGVFRNLDKEFLEIFKKFIEEGGVDVFPKKGKTSGAFVTHNLLTHPTYLLLNHNDRLRDVLTFAHELGHGINNELCKQKQNSINFGTPTSTAEVASTFVEDFVFQELLKKANDELKLSLMMIKLNEDVSTIFRQIAFYNFETDLHKKFREIGYLSKDEIGKLFQKHTSTYMGDYVEQSPGSENWWVYVDHFRRFFYVYSYASGLLISKSLQASVKKDPKFILRVKEFLSAGLSDSPKNIFKKLGIDITDKKFWEKGIAEVEKLLEETEKLAKDLGKI